MTGMVSQASAWDAVDGNRSSPESGLVFTPQEKSMGSIIDKARYRQETLDSPTQTPVH